jgi:hypothetical protein
MSSATAGTNSDRHLPGQIRKRGEAAQIYHDAIARCRDHPHAVRILARAWLYVIWECWHHGVAYEPARHRSLQRLLAAQNADAKQAA